MMPPCLRASATLRMSLSCGFMGLMLISIREGVYYGSYSMSRCERFMIAKDYDIWYWVGKLVLNVVLGDHIQIV